MGTISGYSLNLDIKQMMEQTIHETLQSYRNDNDDNFELPF
jgi:hypothetical protein